MLGFKRRLYNTVINTVENYFNPSISLTCLKIEQAIKCGNSDKLKLLIKKANYNDINTTFIDRCDKTILMFTCGVGNIDCVKVILENTQCDINSQVTYSEYNNNTILTSVCLSGNLDILHYLIDKGLVLNDSLIFDCFYTLKRDRKLHITNIDIMMSLLSHVQDVNYTHEPSSLLHLLCLAGSVELTSSLIDRGADPNATDIDGCDALYFACAGGSVEVVKLILDIDLNKALYTDRVNYAYKVACSTHHLKVIRYLIEQGADTSDTYTVFSMSSHKALMLLACVYGHAELIRLVLEHGADINSFDFLGQDALFVAAREGQVEVVKVLLECDIGEPIYECSILLAYEEACKWRHIEVAKCMIASKYMKEACAHGGYCPWVPAVASGLLALVEYIIDQGVDVNSTDQSGNTMLLTAYKHTKWTIIKLLLVRGADPNPLDRRGHRLIYTVMFDNRSQSTDMIIADSSRQLAQLLLDHGADLNLPCKDGSTILLIVLTQYRYMSNRVYIELITWLLDRGADANLVDTRTGKTSLLIAVTDGHIDLVKLLLEHGADVNYVNYKTDMTALMIAAVTGHLELVKLLLEHYADVTQLDYSNLEEHGRHRDSRVYTDIIALCEQYVDINRPFIGLK